MKNLLYTIFLLLIIWSCASQPSNSIPHSFDPNSNEGMLIGAIALKNEKPIFNGYFFHYFSESNPKNENWIHIAPAQTVKMQFKPDFFDDDKAVYFFAITAKPGNYNFSKIRLFENAGIYQANENLPINIPFTIEKGKVKYIGEIYLDFNNQAIQLSDKKERDIPKLNVLYKSLNIE